MAAVSIHRFVEQHAAMRGNMEAVVDGARVMSYRDVNQQANAVARYLMGFGFRRGGHALVRMPRGVDLAVVLLAVLKAGGSYAWIEPTGSRAGYPPSVSIANGRRDSNGLAEDQYVTVDMGGVLLKPIQPSPNLPILTRGSDIACVLPDDHGSPAVLVPHGTVVSLCDEVVPQAIRWVGEAGALDLWLGLMTGVTVTVQADPVSAAA